MKILFGLLLFASTILLFQNIALKRTKRILEVDMTEYYKYLDKLKSELKSIFEKYPLTIQEQVTLISIKNILVLMEGNDE